MDNHDRPNYSGEERFYRPRPPRSPQPFRRENLATIIASLSLVLTIIFVSITFMFLERLSSSSSLGLITLKATPTPALPTPISTAGLTPTPSPVIPALPCVVDLSSWKTGSADWEILNGVLLNAGTNENFPDGPTIVAPCQLNNAVNYAVETKIQVISETDAPCFGLTVRGSSVGRYMAGVGDCRYYPARAYLTGPDYSNDSVNPSVSFDPSTSLHTYRVEVNGNVIRFLIDGDLILSIVDNRYLTGTQVGLWSKNVQLQVTSFQVTALS